MQWAMRWHGVLTVLDCDKLSNLERRNSNGAMGEKQWLERYVVPVYISAIFVPLQSLWIRTIRDNPGRKLLQLLPETRGSNNFLAWIVRMAVLPHRHNTAIGFASFHPLGTIRRLSRTAFDAALLRILPWFHAVVIQSMHLASLVRVSAFLP